VGEKDLGDGRFDYIGLVQEWFDHFLKGVSNDVLTKNPRVRSYMMGVNKWQSYDSWPPREMQPTSYYLDSDGGANTRLGDGRLTTTKPAKTAMDKFTYDPMTPVPTWGGGTWCCYSHNVLTSGEQAGAYDQSGIEMRADVLVYTTPPLSTAVEVTGPVKVSLYLSSDRKDTDLTVKLIDVDTAGHAYNIDESIQRVRWREGYDRAVFMEPGKVYKVDFSPLTTSNAFLPGHRIRVEISSSNFPHYERNLNTGGNNYDEKDPLVAHNVIHHGPMYPSSIELPVIRAR
jgi:putative CocE/NonD family hydrolase